MSTSTDHFAQDQELLEEFVLGRLDQESDARCREHLRACETCRQAVQAEQSVAAGIKRAGRDRLKKRIAMLALEAAPRRVPWPHVLSVAAVLLILIGIGVTQRWFTTRLEPEKPTFAETPAAEQKLESPAAKAQLDRAQPAETMSDAASPSRQRGEVERRDESRLGPQKETDERHAYAAAPQTRFEESPALDSKGGRSADADKMVGAARAPGEEFWTNGTLITETVSKKDVMTDRASKPSLAGEMNVSSALREKAEPIGNVVVEQRPATRLPLQMQNQQQLYNRLAIQTLVRLSENETQLTLYPDSLFDSTQVQYARVQQVTPESLVVQIGNQQIGYKLPAGLLRQTGKAKRR
jgi:hypothetical protein